MVDARSRGREGGFALTCDAGAGVGRRVATCGAGRSSFSRNHPKQAVSSGHMITVESSSIINPFSARHRLQHSFS